MSLDGQRIRGREHRITSPSLLHHPKEQGLAAVESAGRRGRSSKQKKRSRSSDGREKRKGTERRRRRRGSWGGERSGIRSPISEPVEEEGRRGERSREAREKRRRRKRETQSLPRDALRSYDDSDAEREKVRGRKKERERGRSRSRSRGRKSRSEERVRRAEDEQPEQEEEQEVPAVEERVEEKVEEVEEEVDVEREESEEDVFLPIPNPNQKLPRPKQNWEVKYEENWDMAAEYRELRKVKELEGEDVREQERSWDGNRETELSEDQRDDHTQSSGHVEGPLPSVAAIDVVSQRKPFSFLTSTLSIEQLGDDESESGGSQSDGSVSAASISGLSLAATKTNGRRAVMLPGPWLTPSQQRVAQVLDENRSPGSRTGQGRGRSAVS